MRVAVLGAGAIGSLVGGLLAPANEVTLVGRRQHMDSVARLGLRITGLLERTAHPGATTSFAALPRHPELLLVTVKAYDTARAAEEIAAAGYAGPVVSLQNGIGNLQALAAAVRGPVLAGITSIGVRSVGPGEVDLTGHGETLLGSPGGGHGPLLDRLAAALTEGGLPTTVHQEIGVEIWRKAVVNAGINPLTAITGLPNGALVEEPRLGAVLTAAVAEACTVARAMGYPIETTAMVEQTMEVARRTGRNRSSMLQDIERGRRTEVDSITGVFVERGRALLVPVPVSETLLALVHGIERTTASGGPGASGAETKRSGPTILI